MRWEVQEPDLARIAEYFEIAAPIIDDWNSDESVEVLVLVGSERRAAIAELFATYFRRELHYDFPPYSVANQNDHYREVYLIAGVTPIVTTATPLCFGALEVRWVQGGEVLMWCWLHPFARGLGFWSQEVWPALESRYPDLLLQVPLSDSMRRFVDISGIASHRLVTVG